MDDELESEAIIDEARDGPVSTHESSGAPGINTPVTLSHLLNRLYLPGRLADLAFITTISFPSASGVCSLSSPITSILSILHLRALEALNNLLLTVAAALSSDSSMTLHVSAQDLWDRLFRTVSTIGAESEVLDGKGHEMRREVLEMTLGCLWGLVKVAPAAPIQLVRRHCAGNPSLIPSSGRPAGADTDFDGRDEFPAIRYRPHAVYRDTRDSSHAKRCLATREQGQSTLTPCLPVRCLYALFRPSGHGCSSFSHHRHPPSSIRRSSSPFSTQSSISMPTKGGSTTHPCLSRAVSSRR